MCKQHEQYYRKIGLRRRLLEKMGPGAVYVPFIGDGDIAADLYTDREIWGADIDQGRINKATDRLTERSERTRLRACDCNCWPFAREDTPIFTIADFDPYNNPYASFRAFWKEAPKASRMALFFTDGLKQEMLRAFIQRHPDGSVIKFLNRTAMRRVHNTYEVKVIKPWLASYINPYIIKVFTHYRRGPNVLHWGVIVEKVEK